MCTVKFVKSLLVVSLISALAACGGGGGTGGDVVNPDDSVTSTVLSGQVADGYLNGARVFLDRNRNLILDSGEPRAESGDQGKYSLDIRQGEENLYPVVVEIIAGKTIDEDTPQQYVAESYRLEAPVGRGSFVSPLTTLVKNELDKNAAFSIEDAEASIRSKLGLSAGTSLFEDYIQGQDDAEMLRAHRAARIIASLMGSLQAEIVETQAESQRVAISLMISDQIMNNADAISAALDSEENAGTIEEIKTAILAESNLDSELLDRYVEQLEDSVPGLDLTPPKLTSHNPASGAVAVSTWGTVTLTFDEEIDPASVSEDTIQLFSEYGLESGAFTFNSTYTEFTFETDNYLLMSAEYQVEVAGIADVFGNLLREPQSWNFTTGLEAPPGEGLF